MARQGSLAWQAKNPNRGSNSVRSLWADVAKKSAKTPARLGRKTASPHHRFHSALGKNFEQVVLAVVDFWALPRGYAVYVPG